MIGLVSGRTAPSNFVAMRSPRPHHHRAPALSFELKATGQGVCDLPLADLPSG